MLPHFRLNHAALSNFIAAQYEGCGTELIFFPLGEDSWSYKAGQLWISVRRDLQGHVPLSYVAAHELHRAGLEFVVAPLIGRNGQIVQLFEGLPVVVFPYLMLSSLATIPTGLLSVGSEVLGMLQVLHSATVHSRIPSETFSYPFEAKLSSCIATVLQSDPGSGPYSGKLHRLIMRHRTAIRLLRREAARLSRHCINAPGIFVITHGEPSAQNLLRSGGVLRLIDWGALSMAPPERDLFHVQRTFHTSVSGRAEFFRFYELRWILGEIAEYTEHFILPHTGDLDDEAMWGRLLRYLPDEESSATTRRFSN